MALEEMKRKMEVLESRIIELEKINAFQEEESKEYVTRDQASVNSKQYELELCGTASK
jgi:uncharacterized coiled-coil protein SlyX